MLKKLSQMRVPPTVCVLHVVHQIIARGFDVLHLIRVPRPQGLSTNVIDLHRSLQPRREELLGQGHAAFCSPQSPQLLSRVFVDGSCWVRESTVRANLAARSMLQDHLESVEFARMVMPRLVHGEPSHDLGADALRVEGGEL